MVIINYDSDRDEIRAVLAKRSEPNWAPKLRICHGPQLPPNVMCLHPSLLSVPHHTIEPQVP